MGGAGLLTIQMCDQLLPMVVPGPVCVVTACAIKATQSFWWLVFPLALAVFWVEGVVESWVCPLGAFGGVGQDSPGQVKWRSSPDLPTLISILG